VFTYAKKGIAPREQKGGESGGREKGDPLKQKNDQMIVGRKYGGKTRKKRIEREGGENQRKDTRKVPLVIFRIEKINRRSRGTISGNVKVGRKTRGEKAGGNRPVMSIQE